MNPNMRNMLRVRVRVRVWLGLGLELVPPLRRIQENEFSQKFNVLYPIVVALDYSKQY